jgi:hypothetical protein
VKPWNKKQIGESKSFSLLDPLSAEPKMEPSDWSGKCFAESQIHSHKTEGRRIGRKLSDIMGTICKDNEACFTRIWGICNYI